MMYCGIRDWCIIGFKQQTYNGGSLNLSETFPINTQIALWYWNKLYSERIHTVLLQVMIQLYIMASSNENIFRVTDSLWREFTGHRRYIFHYFVWLNYIYVNDTIWCVLRVVKIYIIAGSILDGWYNMIYQHFYVLNRGVGLLHRNNISKDTVAI